MTITADTQAHALAVRMLTDPETALIMAVELQALRSRDADRYDVASDLEDVADTLEQEGHVARANRLRVLAVRLART